MGLLYKDIFNPKDDVKSMVKDIETLKDLLEQHLDEIIEDSGNLNKVRKSIEESPNEAIWVHDLRDGIRFKLEHLDEPSPPFLEIEKAKLTLSMCLAGKYINKRSLNDVKDPVESLSTIEGYKHLHTPYSCDIEIIAEDIDLVSFWHFDKHFESSTATKKKKKKRKAKNKYIHPEYHWTYGGKKLDTKLGEDETLGISFIVAAPRIGHPPLDVPLAIDYVLQNYVPERLIRSLRNESSYIKIMQRSQYRLWRPYAISFASLWGLSGPYNFSENLMKKFIPELYT